MSVGTGFFRRGESPREPISSRMPGLVRSLAPTAGTYEAGGSPRRSRWPGVLVAALLAATTLAAEPQAGAPTPVGDDRMALAFEALMRLQGVDLNQNPKLRETVLQVLEKTRGTAHFVKLVQQFKLADQNAGLLEVAVRNADNETGVEAMRLILASQDFALLQTALAGTNLVSAIKVTEALGNTKENQITALLLPAVGDARRDPGLRKQAVRSLAQTAAGAVALLKLAKEDRLAADLKFTASAELNRSRWPEIKDEAAKILPPPAGKNAQPLPPLAELMKMRGDAVQGAKVFASETTGCSKCHRVSGNGGEVGPDLSTIGAKLALEALYEAILEPSAGISFGYEAWQIALKNGDEAYGLIVSETAEELAVKDLNGIVTRHKKSEVASRAQSKLSLMPAGLQQTMSPQELVDLVEYLSTLKSAAKP